MHRDEALARAAAGLPITSARELVHMLAELQRRTIDRSPVWYLLNRLGWIAMEIADEDDREKGRAQT